jgi:hypothetical protein
MGMENRRDFTPQPPDTVALAGWLPKPDNKAHAAAEL